MVSEKVILALLESKGFFASSYLARVHGYNFLLRSGLIPIDSGDFDGDFIIGVYSLHVDVPEYGFSRVMYAPFYQVRHCVLSFDL